ncbi:hypothetical protein ACFL6I_14115 [candidate division KSB1 bacterium]
MIDQWFIKDIEKVLKNKNRVVVIDESEQAAFLLDLVKPIYPIYKVASDVEDLQIKYEIEKNHVGKKVVIHTTIPRKRLRFIREYCETDGFIEIKQLPTYIREKIFQALGINLEMDGEQLISAAIISVGKNKNYWLDIAHKGPAEMFNTEIDIIPFLSDPEKFTGKLDNTVKVLFFKHLNNLLSRDYIEQPANILAKEFTDHFLHGLLNNSISDKLLKIYHKWLDSISYRNDLLRRIKKFKIQQSTDIWKVHRDHPFDKVDEAWLKEIGQHVNDQKWIEEKISIIEERSRNIIAKQIGADYWQDIVKLLGCGLEKLDKADSLKEVCEFYINEFTAVETAIRNIYTRFLHQKDILIPFQDYYQILIRSLLSKWFEYFHQYQPGQQGLIKDIVKEQDSKTAVVVGDGITWEIAQKVAQNLKNEMELKEDFILAGFPTITENNMSLMYVSTGAIEPHPQKRQDILMAELKQEVVFTSLDEIKGGILTPHYLICTYKDIDSLGEKLQQDALKYFPEMIMELTEKIRILIEGGYKDVYLISDHGFVLTGFLSESEKVEIKHKGEILKAERYIRTVEKQAWGDFFIEMEQKYESYNYVYFAKSANPFKTTGKYGYSHGGLTPQEVIVPKIKFSIRQDQVDKLKVHIANKDQLVNVTGEIYHIILEAEQSTGNLFSSERKVFLVTLYEGKQVNQSDIINIYAGKRHEKDYSFEKYKNLEVILLDAETREQLDKVVITKSTSRDLGGL